MSKRWYWFPVAMQRIYSIKVHILEVEARDSSYNPPAPSKLHSKPGAPTKTALTTDVVKAVLMKTILILSLRRVKNR